MGGRVCPTGHQPKYSGSMTLHVRIIQTFAFSVETLRFVFCLVFFVCFYLRVRSFTSEDVMLAGYWHQTSRSGLEIRN